MKPFRLPQIDNAPSYKRVADAIEQEILGGRLSPGDYLAPEIELATQLGVHRSTVREGIRALENAGLIRRADAKRLVVCVPTNQALAWTIARALGLHKVTFNELWEIQMSLEPLAAANAAQRKTDLILKRLDANLAELERSIEDDRAVIELDIEFHRLVAEATENRALVLSVRPLSLLLFSATADLYGALPQARHRLLAAHRQIIEAIRRGDHDTAQSWMTKHIQDFRRGYLLGGKDPGAPVFFDSDLLRR